MTATKTMRRSPSVIAQDFEADEESLVFSQQLRAAMMVGSLFIYCCATFSLLLVAFCAAPFVPVVTKAVSTLLQGLFTPADCENGYHFALQAPAGGAALAARLTSSFMSVLSSSSSGSVPSSISMASVLYNEPALASLQSSASECE